MCRWTPGRDFGQQAVGSQQSFWIGAHSSEGRGHYWTPIQGQNSTPIDTSGAQWSVLRNDARVLAQAFSSDTIFYGLIVRSCPGAGIFRDGKAVQDAALAESDEIVHDHPARVRRTIVGDG